jgi:hypothetical protein
MFFYCGKLSKNAQAPIRMFWKISEFFFFGYFSIFLELNLFFLKKLPILSAAPYLSLHFLVEFSKA